MTTNSLEHLAAERSPDALCIVDATGTVLYANPALAELMGLAVQDLRGVSYLDTVHPNDRAAAAEGLRAVLEGDDEIHEVSRRINVLDGRAMSFRIRARRTTWNGAPAIVATAQDVESSMRLEHDLTSAKAFLERLIEVSPMVAFRRVGPELKLTYVSPNVGHIFGYEPAQVLGSSFESGVERAHPEDRERMRDQIERAVAGERAEITYRLRIADGTYRWVVSTLRPDPASPDETALLGYMFDVTRQREVEKELEWLAFHDPLTGLANRAKFESDAKIHLSLSSRKGWRTAILYIDLDRFKDVNDTFGHEAGDTVLETLAKRISEEVRDGDLVARLGGDEFIVMLPDVGDDAAQIAQRVHDALTAPIDIEGTQTSVGASIGMAFFPDDDDDLDRLRKLADDAMYTAKRQGTDVVAWSKHVGNGENA